MNTKPIIFNADMIRALLDGRKTQTRRVVKKQPGDKDQEIKFDGRWLMYRGAGIGWHKDQLCPYGQSGDLLWVRETFGYLGADGDWPIDYRATSEPDDPESGWGFPPDFKWRPSIHMPRWASRITLRITDVRVQRLRDLSEEDAKAEGVMPVGPFGGEHRAWFASQWEKLYGLQSWLDSPWVWALTFEVIQANVDDVLKEAA